MPLSCVGQKFRFQISICLQAYSWICVRQTLACILYPEIRTKSCVFVCLITISGLQNVYFKYLSVTHRLLYVFCSPILPSLRDALIYVLIRVLGISVMALSKIVKKENLLFF